MVVVTTMEHIPRYRIDTSSLFQTVSIHIVGKTAFASPNAYIQTQVSGDTYETFDFLDVSYISAPISTRHIVALSSQIYPPCSPQNRQHRPK
jgi:hypothetical protein